ncbi:30S ribosomal protein S4 [Mahella australiensis]|uniref:Small ribosomal subunit protein uS4 n=1 Tax=Mahella australiensis (strain DSM 15567 / CIP 107919 / 50-1 BON) TaxID=697281 RepID=F4A2V7_MAHA5|nr:30S ribosomal protein S4 [Mahella australiensis]AEE97300.1 SSU ribosomal protein S4P [Mahella australiensis 50-1 BON]
MARYIDSVCKQCRAEGMKLYLKGERCYNKCSFDKRPVAPGVHSQSRRKQSEYGLQLREKQKAKRVYGVLEDQFRRYFEMAERMKGITGENLLQLLERRLDNTVYRIGFADSRAQARQLVRHGHITVNGRKVNIPSYSVKPGDIIAVKGSSRQLEIFKALQDKTPRTIPAWLQVDMENYTANVVAMPAREDIDIPIEEHLIVELYSK